MIYGNYEPLSADKVRGTVSYGCLADYNTSRLYRSLLADQSARYCLHREKHGTVCRLRCAQYCLHLMLVSGQTAVKYKDVASSEPSVGYSTAHFVSGFM